MSYSPSVLVSDFLATECADGRQRMTINESSVSLPSNQSLKILTKTSKLSCRAYYLYSTSDCVDLQFNTDELCTVFTTIDNQSYLEYIKLSALLSVLCISGMVTWKTII